MHNNYTEDYLAHHGILGMKWGVRKFQAKNGSLTSAGKKRYDTGSTESKKKIQLTDKQKSTAKKIAIGGAAVVGGTLLATYGANKVKNIIDRKHSDMIASYGKQYLVSAMKKEAGKRKIYNELGNFDLRGKYKTKTDINNRVRLMGMHDAVMLQKAKREAVTEILNKGRHEAKKSTLQKVKDLKNGYNYESYLNNNLRI